MCPASRSVAFTVKINFISPHCFGTRHDADTKNQWKAQPSKLQQFWWGMSSRSALGWHQNIQWQHQNQHNYKDSVDFVDMIKIKSSKTVRIGPSRPGDTSLEGSRAVLKYNEWLIRAEEIQLEDKLNFRDKKNLCVCVCVLTGSGWKHQLHEYRDIFCPEKDRSSKN